MIISDTKIEKMSYIISIIFTVLNIFCYNSYFMDYGNLIIIFSILLIFSNIYRIHTKNSLFNRAGIINGKDLLIILFFVMILELFLFMKMTSMIEKSSSYFIMLFLLFTVLEIGFWIIHNNNKKASIDKLDK